MCGIWGIVNRGAAISQQQIEKIIKELFILSETRGKEASGFAFKTGKNIHIMKRDIEASKLIRSNEYKKMIHKCFSECTTKDFMIIGHSRLVTNGTAHDDENNQPIYVNDLVTVHNGIIVNCDKLWEQNTGLKKESEVDTEIFAKLCKKYICCGMSPQDTILKIYSEIEGMASTITLFGNSNILVCASNNGSLYYMVSKDQKLILIASERLIMQRLWRHLFFLHDWFSLDKITHVMPNEVISFESVPGFVATHKVINHKRTSTSGKEKKSINVLNNRISLYEIDNTKIKKLKRCSKCLLPVTMPFIEFDNNGECNYCRTYKKMKYKSKGELERWAEKQRKKDGENDSIVSFSGGRDSSYGLHYFVKELGLKPIAYSYDWGMVTDLARRNQSRMCSQLGIEFVLVSANIRAKRTNIRKNVAAWLKSPALGLVPLFMAGDKHYFYYANKVRKDYGLDTILMASNPFEKTHFKSGFCNVKPTVLKQMDKELELEQLNITDIFKMGNYYVEHFLKNTAFINSSLWDTIKATASYYVIPHNYFRLFNYIEWNEEKINDVLLNQYGWELASDTKSTWRIGDGTAPFYNYIYYCVCGFTENDTLRSNQIREGMITREKGLELIEQDNRVRWDSLKWYFDTIDLDMYDALKVIKKMPKLYE